MVTCNISAATRRNWDKLGADPRTRLTRRANKLLSQKRFVPTEYFTHSKNIPLVRAAIDVIAQKKSSTFDIICTLATIILRRRGLLDKDNVKAVVADYPFTPEPVVADIAWPNDERDLLGIVYQSLQFEGDKNRKGSYYTPAPVARNMVRQLDFNGQQRFLDPCCGSGTFLMALNNVAPNRLFGIDNDPIAAFMAKINLLLKFPDFDFIPNIVCGDFLQRQPLSFPECVDSPQHFDYIVTNPPWGAVANGIDDIPEISSHESFSYFFVKAFDRLTQNGTIRFLLPEAVLNVKLHKDVRKFILTHCCIEAFTFYDRSFSGVTTKYVDIKCHKKAPATKVRLYRHGTAEQMPVGRFYETGDFVFNFIASRDMAIIRKVKNAGRYNLADSFWALGIITGDNKNTLLPAPADGFEPIYTGKEIMPYALKEAKNYIRYDRNRLQQVAKDALYRADKKLVYKFISNRLVFAYDDQQRLFLNSANILIPKIPNMSIKTVMAFLNSELYQYLYVEMFGGLKILKSNLLELPFPKITPAQDKAVAMCVDKIIAKQGQPTDLQPDIYNIFKINSQQIQHIKATLMKLKLA